MRSDSPSAQEKLAQGSNGIETVAKGANLIPYRMAKRRRKRAQCPFRQIGNGSSRSTHAHRKNGQGDGDDQATQGGVLQGLVMGQGRTVRSQQQSAGKDQRHRSQIEHALHRVNRYLRAQRQLGSPRDQVRTHQIRKTAEERHRGKANHLRAQQPE